MNEFTKEELTQLKTHIDCSLAQCDDTENLIIKIQSMIDNYCEHESDGYTYYKSGTKCTDFLTYASHDSPCFLKCKKCEELFK